MMYRFSIDIYLISPSQQPTLHSRYSGEIEAERSSSAQILAWPMVYAECKRISTATGQQTGVGDMSIQAQEASV